jgi:DNA-binding protein HU-beta
MGTKTEMCIIRFNWTDRLRSSEISCAHNDCCDAVRILLSARRIDEQYPCTDCLRASSQKSDGVPPIVTLKVIFEQIAETYALPKKQAAEMVGDFVTAVTAHLQSGSRIRMSGLGTLEVRKREARVGRNPATGEAIQIMASKKVTFRPAKELKEAV